MHFILFDYTSGAMTSLCHEIATVTKELPQKKIQVVVKRSEACGSCSAKGACQSLGGQTKDFFITLDNPLEAQVGQRVRISLSEGDVIRASAILYLIPAISLMIFAMVGNVLGASHFNTSSDIGAISGALIGLGIGFSVSAILAKRAERNNKGVPSITAIVRDCDNPPQK